MASSDIPLNAVLWSKASIGRLNNRARAIHTRKLSSEFGQRLTHDMTAEIEEIFDKIRILLARR
jgi:hypothetical protein